MAAELDEHNMHSITTEQPFVGNQRFVRKVPRIKVSPQQAEISAALTLNMGLSLSVYPDISGPVKSNTASSNT
jgi:hypothetical protein